LEVGMFGIGIVEVGVLLLIPLLVLGVSAYLLATARRAAVMDEQLARARRHQVGISVLAAAVALATMPAAAALTPWLGQSTVLPLLPSLMVAAACAVLWVGEVTFPRPSGMVRSTVLNPRGLESVLPRGWVRLCIGLAVFDLGLFVLTAATADGGNAISWQDGDEVRVATPYPGLAYVVPQLLALTCAALVAWMVCRAAINRPTIATDLEGDAVLRRASGGRVLRWLAWGLVATAAGNLLTAGSSWQSVSPSAWDPVGAVAMALGVALVVVAIVLPFVPVARLARGTMTAQPNGSATLGAR
jgi:hypothetical protein